MLPLLAIFKAHNSAWLAALATAAPNRLQVVIHPGSPETDSRPPPCQLTDVGQQRVRKINVGTEFRQRYGQALRKTLANDPAIFDRTEIMLASVSSSRALAVELLMASWHGDV